MHFLAHLLAAKANPYYEIGQIAGDFVRQKDASRLDARILDGYRKHVAVDAFTDRHSSVSEAKKVLRGPFRRYAGLTLDLYFDHLIARQWLRIYDGDYDAVVNGIYNRLEEHALLWPPEMMRFTRFLIDSDLLQRLREPQVMYDGMRRITKRLKRDIDIEALVNEVFEREVLLQPHFRDYISDFNTRFLDKVR